uniref:Sprouty-related, EVH1 domain-containing protein 2 n=1 Tax=Diabrotica virgifera virgifera TaxID=50390 RepID=A0A6P7FQ51_DIAVI
MTDPRAEDGNYLVRVRAQVMSRDDSSGGWVPLGGGGLSNVSVRKRPRPTPSAGPGGGGPLPPDAQPTKPKHDYLIYGKRISDNSIVLSCTIKKDFEYNKVMPTFHHWKTGDKKYGLTFQAAADARAFDKGVKTAIQDLLDGFADTSPVSPMPKCPKDVGDDDVFMTLNLPQDPKDSRSSSDSSTKGTEHLHKVTYIGRDSKPLDSRLPTYDPQKGPKGECRHCHEYYTEDKNPRGACEYAPDVIKTAINRITCLGCAEGIDYHCASDEEGDFAQHPCDCSDENCAKRWFCLTFLSILVPCLWLYPPLKMCHWCGVKCGMCGGRHSM